MAVFSEGIPNPLSGFMGAGRRITDAALEQASERFGQTGAKRNAEDAIMQDSVQKIGSTIMACNWPWHAAAIDNLPADEKPQALNQAAIEREALPELEAVRDQLELIKQSRQRPAIMPLVQYGSQLMQRATGSFVPSPRQPID